MGWFCVDVEESLLSSGSFHRLCRKFQRAFITAGAPAEMALFATNDGQRVHRLYFSPGSIAHVEDLIERYGGRRCEQPGRDALTLLFGVPDAKERLFCPAPQEGHGMYSAVA